MNDARNLKPKMGASTNLKVSDKVFSCREDNIEDNTIKRTCRV